LILGGVFGDGGSNGPTSGCTKSKMAAGRHLGKFRMTISQDSMDYETYSHVTDDVACRKW